MLVSVPLLFLHVKKFLSLRGKHARGDLRDRSRERERGEEMRLTCRYETVIENRGREMDFFFYYTGLHPIIYCAETSPVCPPQYLLLRPF